MSLAAALAATKAARPRTRLDEIWEALDTQDRGELLDALTNPKVPHGALVEALTAIGHPISKTTIGDARRSGWAASKETS